MLRRYLRLVSLYNLTHIDKFPEHEPDRFLEKILDEGFQDFPRRVQEIMRSLIKHSC